MAEESYDFDIVFIPDVEWDVDDGGVTEMYADLGVKLEVPCVKPWEKRAVQGCFCAKCSAFRQR